MDLTDRGHPELAAGLLNGYLEASGDHEGLLLFNFYQVYRALVRADATTLKAAGKPLTVLPGMTGTAEIRTGRRSVLSFLLRPMLKAQEAFTER